MNINIRPRKIFMLLLYLIFTLLVLNIIGIISILYFDYNLSSFIPLFNFNNEKSIPTLYSTLALFFASTLLFIIAIVNKRTGNAYLSWLGLAFIFLFLSIDENLELHERLTEPARTLLGTSGVFYYAWIIPYGVALIVFAIFYLKFLINLPRNIMILFIVSGTIFVLGAVGFEMFGSMLAEVDNSGNNLMYSFFYTCEEFLEMLGIVIFIYALLAYISSQFKVFTITIH